MNEKDSKEFLFNRQKAYQALFDNPLAQIVIDDLIRFCRAKKSTFDPDARISANLDGRREVYLRIQQHLELDSEQLWKLYGSK